ncbi:MAG: alpha/beta hydrolase-fold protein [Pseudomonadota bacterium]
MNLTPYLLSLLIALSAGTSHAAGAPHTPYALKGTEVFAMPKPHLNKQYEVYVVLPADYDASEKRYPVIYLTDTDYAFPLVRSIANRINVHGVGVEPHILVGLSYAKGDTGTESRNRDYTLARYDIDPSTPGKYGMAKQYLEYLTDTVFPAVEAKYRINTRRRIFVGHSYGSLLGLQALLSEPKLFSHYILGSPSLWYDRRLAFEMEQRYAKQHKEMPAKVRFYIGSYETLNPGKPRYSSENDMVGDMRRFVAQLRSHQYRGLDVDSAVLDDEDHATVFPGVITRGLMWALPAKE